MNGWRGTATGGLPPPASFRAVRRPGLRDPAWHHIRPIRCAGFRASAADAILAAVDAAQEPSPATPGPVRKSALAFTGVLGAALLPGILAQAAQPALGLAWTEVFAFLLPSLVVTAGSNLSIGRWLRLSPPRASALVLGALVGGAGYLLAGALMAATERVLPHGWVRSFDVGRLFGGPAWERVLLSSLAVLLAPPCEEIAFRGYVLTALVQRRRPAGAIAGSALLFAAVHLDPVRFPALVLLGAIFGWLAWRAGSVWPAVAAHAANNAIAAAFVLRGGAPRPGDVPWSAILASSVLGATALAGLLAGYRVLTPRPPSPSEAVAPRDEREPSVRFSWLRVPRGLALATAAGAALLVPIAAAALLHATGAPRGRPPAASHPAAPHGPRR